MDGSFLVQLIKMLRMSWGWMLIMLISTIYIANVKITCQVFLKRTTRNYLHIRQKILKQVCMPFGIDIQSQAKLHMTLYIKNRYEIYNI